MALSKAPQHPAQSIVDLVTQVPTAYRNIPALVDGEYCVTYGELRGAIEPIIKALYANGVRTGDRVALWAPNTYSWILIALAIQWCGGILVPLNTRMKAREVQHILDDSGCRWLFSVGQFLRQDYPALLGEADVLKQVSCVLLPEQQSAETRAIAWSTFIAQGTDVNSELVAELASQVTAESHSDLLFTSGTTGKPKGVLCRHGATIKAFQTYASTLDLRVGEKYLIVNPFFHAFGYKAGWVTALLAGCTILPEAVFDAQKILTRIAKEQINILPGPPTLYTSMLDAADLAHYDISSLRVAVTGSASISPRLIEQMRDTLGIELVLTAYGLTECGGLATLCGPEDSAQVVAHTSGQPIQGTELALCIDGVMTTQSDSVGEICLRGYHIMSGYWQNSGATSEAINAEGWLHTGDLGTLDVAGNLSITGRLKDMYICGGFNCYPAEIEAIIQQHPDVLEVAVVGVPEPRMGEVGCAFVKLKSGKILVDKDFIAWCRTHMANYKAPRHVRFVESFPMNASNKILKHELVDLF